MTTSSSTRIALGIEYDGSRFLGWQTQPGGGTVQDALEAALSAIAGETVSVTCAGRTDRGVHARGQVVHFDTQAERPDSAWVRGVNAMLPESVAVLWSRRVAADFHARYAAISRTYRYVLLNRPVRPSLAAGYAGWHHAPLALEPMREAAARSRSSAGASSSNSPCAPTPGCNTWCATSSVRWYTSARAGMRRNG
jgi:tRNA pseudouridine38-40 synthase